MKKVLVTGAGGGVGESILKSFQDSDYQVIATDNDPLAAGLYAVPRAYHVPLAQSPGFIDRILDICRRESCKLIFPGTEPELVEIAKAAERFRAAGILPVVSSWQVVETCDDKLLTSIFLRKHGFDSPATVAAAGAQLDTISLPVVLKPMKGGARSIGVYLVHTRQELQHLLSTLDLSNYVLQEYVEGEEYTCGSVNFDGRCYGTIVMRRILRDGDTYKAFVENDPAIHACVKKAAETLRPFGACNFQLRARDGRYFIFEINARCSGTTYCRAIAGFNEPLMIADFITEGKQPRFSIREISILRYWNELEVPSDRIREFESRRELSGDNRKL